MAYTTINVYGSGASSARTRAALVIAIKAAMDGKQVLLTESGATQLQMLLPGKLLSASTDLFAVSGIPDDRLIIALLNNSKNNEDELSPYLTDCDLLVCCHASTDNATGHNQLLVGGYDGLLLRDISELAPKLPQAKILAAVPQPLPTNFGYTKKKAAEKVPVLGHDPLELPLFNYTSIAVPNGDTSNALWQGCDKLLRALDYSQQTSVSTTPDDEAIRHATPSDGSLSGATEVTLPTPPVTDTVVHEAADHALPTNNVDQLLANAEAEAQEILAGFDQETTATAEQLEQLEQERAQERDELQQEHEQLKAARETNQATRKAALAEEADALTTAEIAATQLEEELQERAAAEELARLERLALAEQEKLAAKQREEEVRQAELKRQEQERLADQARRAEARAQEEQKRKTELEEATQQFEEVPVEKPKAEAKKLNLAPAAATLVKPEPEQPPEPKVHKAAPVAQPAASLPDLGVTEAAIEVEEKLEQGVAELTPDVAEPPAEVVEEKIEPKFEAKTEAHINKVEAESKPEPAEKSTAVGEEKTEAHINKIEAESKPEPTEKSTAIKEEKTPPDLEKKAADAEAKSDDQQDQAVAAKKAEKTPTTKKRKVQRKLIKAAKIQRQTTEVKFEKFIDYETIVKFAKYHGAKSILLNYNFRVKHPNHTPLVIHENAEPHLRFREISDWCRAMPTSQKESSIIRYTVLNLFALAEDESAATVANISRESALDYLSDYKVPDFELLVAWYRHACFVAHFYFAEKNFEAASKVVPQLIHQLYATKDIFFEQITGLDKPEELHNLMLAGLAILSAKIEELNPARFDDSDIESMLHMANSIKENLSDEYKVALEPPIEDDNGKVAASVEAAADAFGDM